MKMRTRIIAFTALTLLAGSIAAPAPSFAQNARERFQQMSVEQLQQRLQRLQSGQSNLSGAMTARRIRQIRRELANRAAEQARQQQQQSQQPQQPPADTGNVNREARQYLRSTENLRRLSDRDLVRSIRQGRDLVQKDGLRGNLQRQVRARVQDVRAERQRRQQAQQPQQPPADTGNVNREARQYLRSTENLRRLSDRDLVRSIRQGRDLVQKDGLRGNLQRQVRARVQDARAERQRRQQAQQPQQPPADTGNVNREARQYLRSTENLRRLSDRDLVRSIRQGRDLVQKDGLRGNLQRQVRARVQDARAERQRRQQAQQPPADTGMAAAARRLLDDNRPASALRDPQLRNRLEEARRIMSDRSLDRRLFARVRRMARLDRDELRARVARRDQNRAERREDRQNARQLLNDPRSASQLNDRQLQARITSARDLLTSGNLRPRQKNRIEGLLREARREKRGRLLAERQRRRERLEQRRRQNQIIIQLPGLGDFRDRDDIAAAEADDELLERQLVAPPTRRIQRRYSRSDFRSDPRIRNLMPAIEVDTIRFGFNEAFVREEEIPQLERIGEIIERIVAGNPNEVFLIEGHTDAVGSGGYNLGLSQKRADAVRDAMLRYFNIGAQNIETIGYGEQFLKIQTQEEEQENRRVTIRRITPLLTGQR
jgi:outer membrane protein OmpA-like peptidoglycan-associated protein